MRRLAAAAPPASRRRAPLKALLRPLRDRLRAALGAPFDKAEAELAWWRERHRVEGAFASHHYRELMLAMAGEDDARFLAGRVVADFGCGPRGSLAWATAASARLGIDLLASRYFELFPCCLGGHGMTYVTSTEAVIPLPDAAVDVLFTVNALDHVADFPAMCRELRRVLRPGGELVASVNLEEPPTLTEPQRLRADDVDRCLLAGFAVRSRRCSRRGPDGDVYRPLLAARPEPPGDGPGLLWVRASKPEAGVT